jgi:hypothetical protein
MSGAELLLARIRVVRAELDEIGRLLLTIGGDKAQGRVLSDLRDRTNDLANEVMKEASDDPRRG